MLCHITIILLSFVQTDSEAQDEHEVKVWIFLDFFGAAPGPATVLRGRELKVIWNILCKCWSVNILCECNIFIFYTHIYSYFIHIFTNHLFQEKRSKELQKQKYKKKENKAFTPSHSGCCLEDFTSSLVNPLVPLFVEKCILFIETEGNTHFSEINR